MSGSGRLCLLRCCNVTALALTCVQFAFHFLTSSSRQTSSSSRRRLTLPPLKYIGVVAEDGLDPRRKLIRNQFRSTVPCFEPSVRLRFPAFSRIKAASGRGSNFTSLGRIPRGYLSERSLGYESVGENPNGRRAPRPIVLRPSRSRQMQLSFFATCPV